MYFACLNRPIFFFLGSGLLRRENCRFKSFGTHRFRRTWNSCGSVSAFCTSCCSFCNRSFQRAAAKGRAGRQIIDICIISIRMVLLILRISLPLLLILPFLKEFRLDRISFHLYLDVSAVCLTENDSFSAEWAFSVSEFSGIMGVCPGKYDFSASGSSFLCCACSVISLLLPSISVPALFRYGDSS